MSAAKAIHGVLVMIVTNLITQAMPPELTNMALVVALPFQLFGMYWFLTDGIEPAAEHIAMRYADSDQNGDKS